MPICWSSSMADEHISYAAMVNDEVGPMAYMTHSEDFGLCGDRAAPVANGVGAKLEDWLAV